MKKVRLLAKFVAVCLCCAMFVNTPMNAYAMEADNTYVTPRYASVSDYSLSLSVASGNAHISANLNGKSGVSESYIKCNLEKLSGSYWVQLQSFSSTGTSSTSLSADYGVEKGTYRVMGTFRCDSETITAYSANQTY